MQSADMSGLTHPDLIMLADRLAIRWASRRATPAARRHQQDEAWLGAREDFLATLQRHGIDRDLFVEAVS